MAAGLLEIPTTKVSTFSVTKKAHSARHPASSLATAFGSPTPTPAQRRHLPRRPGRCSQSPVQPDPAAATRARAGGRAAALLRGGARRGRPSPPRYRRAPPSPLPAYRARGRRLALPSESARTPHDSGVGTPARHVIPVRKTLKIRGDTPPPLPDEVLEMRESRAKGSRRDSSCAGILHEARSSERCSQDRHQSLISASLRFGARRWLSRDRCCTPQQPPKGPSPGGRQGADKDNDNNRGTCGGSMHFRLAFSAKLKCTALYFTIRNGRNVHQI